MAAPAAPRRRLAAPRPHRSTVQYAEASTAPRSIHLDHGEHPPTYLRDLLQILNGWVDLGGVLATGVIDLWAMPAVSLGGRWSGGVGLQGAAGPTAAHPTGTSNRPTETRGGADACCGVVFAEALVDTRSRTAISTTGTFHIGYTLRGVSYLLHRMGFSPQVPAHRAVERDEAAIAMWRK